jgi:hypothetical protein
MLYLAVVLIGAFVIAAVMSDNPETDHNEH